MKVWCYFGADGRICADSSFHDASDVLRTMMGWPTYGEVKRAVEAGTRVLQVEISAESGWRPIETAPRDGQDILLCVLYRDGSWSMMVGHWAEYGRAGWTTGNSWTREPTHWRPLPEPPR